MKYTAVGLLSLLLSANQCSSAIPTRNLKIGETALPFTLSDARGKTHSPETYKGKPLVIVYFRTGHDFSLKALKVLNRLHKKFAAHGAVFLGIWNKDGESQGAPKPAAFPLLEDEQLKFYGSYGLFILPTTLVFDRDHRFKAYTAGYTDSMETELETSLNGILGLKGAAPSPPRYGKAGEILDPRINEARLLLKDGRAEEALAAFKSAGPDQPCPARMVAVEAFIKLNRLPEARKLLADCVKPSATPQAALLMGRVLALSGEHNTAETWLKQAAATSPDAQLAHYYLGNLYEKTGRKDEALSQYRMALERIFSR
ncbi:MAG: redoxin domain-containing protein [Elusimicrobiota bacterium]|nr:redoxin domain-containing protein [Elusimicrobiota bacterium]